MSRLVYSGIGATLGTLAGLAGNFYAKYHADIAFRVRPELENLKWYEGLFSDHFADYLWKMHPEPMLVTSLVIGAVGGACLGLYLKHILE